jgi:lysophospholipase L1-like esterase
LRNATKKRLLALCFPSPWETKTIASQQLSEAFRQLILAPLKSRLACVLTQGIGLAGLAMLALGLMSGTIRSSIPILIDRQVARAWPFTYTVVGDSLAAECPWKWSFGLSPVAVANSAAPGADIRGITHQIELAHDLRPQVMLISGGINDIINNEAPVNAIRYDFGLLLRRLGKEQKSIITLIPYISDRNFTERITAANEAIAELSSKRGILVLDINPLLSADGVRWPEMTRHGIHLSGLACRTWIAAVKSRLPAINAPAPSPTLGPKP